MWHTIADRGYSYCCLAHASVRALRFSHSKLYLFAANCGRRQNGEKLVEESAIHQCSGSLTLAPASPNR